MGYFKTKTGIYLENILNTATYKGQGSHDDLLKDFKYGSSKTPLTFAPYDESVALGVNTRYYGTKETLQIKDTYGYYCKYGSSDITSIDQIKKGTFPQYGKYNGTIYVDSEGLGGTILSEVIHETSNIKAIYLCKMNNILFYYPVSVNVDGSSSDFGKYYIADTSSNHQLFDRVQVGVDTHYPTKDGLYNPTRVIVKLMGAGGGGCQSWGVNNGGAGGGSGAFISCILDTDLSNDGKEGYLFQIGSGGRGGPSGSEGDATNGGDSTIIYLTLTNSPKLISPTNLTNCIQNNSTIVAIAGGGGRGTKVSGGGGGSGGTYTLNSPTSSTKGIVKNLYGERCGWGVNGSSGGKGGKDSSALPGHGGTVDSLDLFTVYNGDVEQLVSQTGGYGYQSNGSGGGGGSTFPRPDWDNDNVGGKGGAGGYGSVSATDGYTGGGGGGGCWVLLNWRGGGKGGDGWISFRY